MAKQKAKKNFPENYKSRIRFVPGMLSKKLAKAKGNTTYEKLRCVGFQPDFNRLEAVVHIRQPVGYGGDICSSGSKEYVRFFLSFDNGNTWDDQGVVSFTAYDIPQAAKKKLEYAVTLKIKPPRKPCFKHNFALVRAILSWREIPPANDPGFIPQWGNVRNDEIQIDPLKLIVLEDLLAHADLKLPSKIAQIVDLSVPVPTVEKQPLSIPELQKLYHKAKVEPHRFGFGTALKMMSDPDFTAETASLKQIPSSTLSIDWKKLISAINKLDGNTSYEELECIGLNPETSELIATFRVKRPYGYSGGPCDKGSIEYVTFWGDFDMDGTYEKCLGTAAVEVYDYKDIPKGGLEYAVFLPVDLTPYQRSCQKGPNVARIRATLSWNTPHPCNKPNQPPYWGNSKNTVIHIPAGPELQGSDLLRPILYTLCSSNVCSIDPLTGLATGDRPFGGVIWITGEFPIGPAVTVPDRFKYRVRVRPLDPVGNWRVLTNDFKVWVTEGSGSGLATTSRLTQTVDSDGFYTYREYGTPVSGSWRRVTGPNRALALWSTRKEDVGRWEIEIRGKDTSTNTEYHALSQTCPDNMSRQNVIVRLDQKHPEVVDLRITHVKKNPAAPWKPASDCDKIKAGSIIKGVYEVSDEHFRKMTLKVLPASAAHGAAVNPASKTYYAPDFEPTTGTSGTWTLDTGGMDPCGYVVLLEVWDRTIASCDSDGWYNRKSVGFCLET